METFKLFCYFINYFKAMCHCKANSSLQLLCCFINYFKAICHCKAMSPCLCIEGKTDDRGKLVNGDVVPH